MTVINSEPQEQAPKHPPSDTDNEPDYNLDSRQAGWDSPELVQQLVEQFIGEGSVVLDIGIGTGQAVQGYAEKGAVVVGIDVDQKMLDAAQAVTGAAGIMRLGSINETLPVGDLQGKVDVAQAVGVLEFAEDLNSAVGQIAAVLKPGGVFAFTIESKLENDDPNVDTVEYPNVGITVHRHSPHEVLSLLEQKGLRLLYDTAYGGYVRGSEDGSKVPYHVFLAQKV